MTDTTARPVTESVALADLPPWRPPHPSELPEWRTQTREYLATRTAMLAMASTINQGQFMMLPTVPGLEGSPGAIASQLLVREERRRLAEASLYYASADMTSLALAAATTPPAEPMKESRLPSPYGLMLFAEPIGGYSMTMPTGNTAVTVPIVAVSWGQWTPRDVSLDRGRVRWLANSSEGPLVIPDAYRGVWLTFYTPDDASGYAAMDPGAVVALGPDGTPTTAGELAQAPRTAPLGWDNELVLAYGAAFEEPKPDTCDQWAQTVYTAWQLMSQGGSRLVDSETVPRPRAGRKRDAREGVTGSSDVRIVNVHSAHRPTRAAAEQDAAASSGRRAPQYSCRWPVRPHRRDHCMNPRAHADNGCEHEERIIPPHIKGPEGKPLRVRETVNLWDHQPDGPGTAAGEGQ
ncbi:hypothetical protein ACFY0R_37850 [Streptomyces sp. NPDC001633]|uniref:hypothetical protein n=1 Tax=Streptomyces sp. NPDC001633 TaxID=3364595 RepID=UPI0036B966A7